MARARGEQEGRERSDANLPHPPSSTLTHSHPSLPSLTHPRPYAQSSPTSSVLPQLLTHPHPQSSPILTHPHPHPQSSPTLSPILTHSIPHSPIPASTIAGLLQVGLVRCTAEESLFSRKVLPEFFFFSFTFFYTSPKASDGCGRPTLPVEF